MSVPEKGGRRNLYLPIIFLTLFLDLMGFGIVIPLLPLYAKNLHATALVVGTLSTVYSLMQFIFAPIWGRLSDRYGRRPLILISLLGSTFSFFLFGIARTLLLLFVARILGGILSSASLPSAQAYIADVTTPDNRAKGMGMIGAAFGLGFIFGPFIGGTLAHFGFAVPFFVATGICFANFLLALAFLPESLQKEYRHEHKTAQLLDLKLLRDAPRHPTIGVLLTLVSLSTFAFANLESMWALFFQVTFHLTEQAAGRLNGYLLALIGLIVAIIQGGLIGRIVKRYGERSTIHFGMALMVIAFVLLSFSRTLGLIILASGCLAIGRGVSDPSLTTLISKNSDQDTQGGILGIAQSLNSLSRVLGPLCGGFVFDHYGPASPMAIGTLFLIVAFLFSLRIAEPKVSMEGVT